MKAAAVMRLAAWLLGILSACLASVALAAAARIETAPSSDRTELILPDGTRHVYMRDAVLEHGNGIQTWIGKHASLGTRHRAILTKGPHGTFGVLSTPTGDWHIEPGADGDRLVDPASVPPQVPLGPDDALPIPPGPRAKRTPSYAPSAFIPREGVDMVARPKSTPSPTYDVDLMIVYTRSFTANAGGDANVQTLLQYLVDRGNVALADSEIALHWRLVRSVEVDYNAVNSRDAALHAITYGCIASACGFDAETFGHIEPMRNAAGADMVLLLRPSSDGGIAFIGTDPPYPDFAYAYGGCGGTGCDYIFAHELGHVLGMAHDRNTVAFQSGGTSNYSGGVRPYAFGYAFCTGGNLTCNPLLPPASGGCTSDPQCGTASNDNFRDIMAYFYGSPVVFKYSNPRLSCTPPSGATHACGIAATDPGSADNAQAVNEYRATVSAMKATVDPPPPPPTFLRFSALAYAGAEGTNVTLTVQRQGNASGTAQVSWHTVDASATAGNDYVAASGVLSWGDGDTTSRTITVSLLADGVAEDNEYFLVQLFQASGSGEVYADAANVPVVIQSPWPPPAGLPAGYSTSAGMSPWSAATDRAYEGTSSLRSAYLGDPSVSSISGLDFTGDFSEGYVVFAYRTSLLPMPSGILDFWVDGQVVLQFGGQTDWTIARYKLAAGRHTLRWRAVSFGGSSCALAANGGTPACEDRAWLDLVTLPTGIAAVAPQFTNPASTTFVVGQFKRFQFTTSGSGHPTFQISGAMPYGLSFSSTGSYSGAAYAGSAGRYIATITASNGTPPDAQQTFTLDVVRQSQSITFAALPDRTQGDPAFTVSATATSGLAARFSSLTTAVCTVSSTTVTLVGAGTCSIAADQDGDGTFAPAMQVVRSFAVRSNVAPTVSLSSSRNPANAGDAVSFTATASGPNGTASGSFDFLDNGAPLAGCTGVASSNGVASCTISTLSVGTHPIVARYSGNSSYAPASSNPVDETINPAPVSAAQAGLSPASVDFSIVSVGTTSTAHDVTLSNTGTATLAISSITVTPQFGQTNDCASSLAPSASCTIHVTFTPAATSGAVNSQTAVSGTLGVQSNAANGAVTTALSGTAEKSLVQHFYQAVLRRQPEPAGHDFWAAQAQAAIDRGSNVNEAWYAMAETFFVSPEYVNQQRTDEGFIEDLYLTFFNREADADGLAYWKSQIASGLPRVAVLVNFMFSAEFRNFTQSLFGNTQARAEVDMAGDFYRGLLARLPDAGGFTYWVGNFRNAQCQGASAVAAQADAISASFVSSAEYINRARSDADFVSDLYDAFMRRGTDKAGLDFWVNELQSGRRTRDDVRHQFTLSPEFSARVNDVSNQGCLH